MAIFFGLISGALNAFLLALVNVAIWRPAYRTGAIFVAFVVLCAAAPFIRVASELLVVGLGQSAVFSLRTELSRQVLSVPLRTMEQFGLHRILSAMTEDIPTITNVVVLIPVLCVNAGVVATCIVYMGWLKWKLLMAVLVVMVIGILAYQFAVGRAIKHFARARQHDNKLQGHFQGLIHGIKELKLHQRRREAFLSQVLSSTAEAARAENVAGMTIYSVALDTIAFWPMNFLWFSRSIMR
ncbi:MAG: ABC transporter transmembrane domain-containing protein [Candidatus Sulfotelmatobacter sp.]